MTTTTGTITGYTYAWTLATTDKAVVSLTADTANASVAAASWTYLSKVEVFLKGEAAADKDPTKGVASWVTTNSAALKTASLDAETNVSSWSVIIKAHTKTDTYKIFPFQKTTPTTDCFNTVTDVVTPTGADNVTTANWGDSWGAHLTVKGNTYNANAIRYGSRVTTASSATVKRADGTGKATYPLTYSTALSDWSKAPTTWPTVTYGTEVTCDTTKWKAASDCDALTRWAWLTGTAVSGATNGAQLAHRWLANAATDKSKVFSIEDKDVLNLYVFEDIINQPTAGTAANASATCTGKAWRSAVATGTYAKGSGATSAILGASALITGLIASLF